MSDVRSIPTWTQAGLDSAKGTPAYIGQTYYATDTGLGYIATGTSDSSDWKVNFKNVTAKGDLLVASGAGVLTLLPVGTDGQLLQADSGEASGLGYISASSATSKKSAMVYGFPSATLVSASSAGAMSWNTEHKDNDGMVDLVTDDTLITIKTAGEYELRARIQTSVPVSGSGLFTATFRKDAVGLGQTASMTRYTSDTLKDIWLELTWRDTFAVDDEIDLYLDSTSGGINVLATGIGQADCWMTVTEL